jgi:hypothetical protein
VKIQKTRVKTILKEQSWKACSVKKQIKNYNDEESVVTKQNTKNTYVCASAHINKHA